MNACQFQIKLFNLSFPLSPSLPPHQPFKTAFDTYNSFDKRVFRDEQLVCHISFWPENMKSHCMCMRVCVHVH